jgi:hypothetical protein
MTIMATVQAWMERLWTFLVNLVANFIADVLEHPRVQEAASTAIVNGINDTLDQPDFPTKIKVISLLTMDAKEQIAVSRQLGEQFPKAAVNFLGGAVAGLRGKSSSKLDKAGKSSKKLKDGWETKKDT